MADKPVIEEREDGPLVVKNLQSLIGEDNQPLETGAVTALCRCGASKKKPFCDGSHKNTGFKSDAGTPAGRDRLITYDGTSVQVAYNPMICSHAAECGRLAAHIFNPAQKPWVQPDNGTRAEVEAVVRACPSGALTLKTATEATHLIASRAQIEVEKNGPYWVTDVDSPAPPKGEAMSERKYVLCRCGQSGNKPYCDGSHRAAGWTSQA